MPTLANPTHWRCIAETDQALYRFEVFLGEKNKVNDLVRYAKPDQNPG